MRYLSVCSGIEAAMRHTMTSLLIILALVASPCLAGTTDDGIPDTRYVDYGKGFAPFTRLLSVVETSGRVTRSTAVVIAPRHCLTAAHVVQDFSAGRVGDNTVAAVTIHEDFERDGFWFDIAVLRCSDDFGLSHYPRLSDGDEKEGDTVAIAGYGIHGPLSQGFRQADGSLRAGTQTIERFERTMIVCAGRRGSSPMEILISPGDSGGPLFVGAGPAARLAGINSCTMRDSGPLKSVEGEESGHTRVAYFKEWINEVVRCADE